MRVWREWACRHGFTWLIRVMRLIGGTPVHRINHVAPIHHDKRSNPPSDPPGKGLAIAVMLGRQDYTAYLLAP